MCLCIKEILGKIRDQEIAREIAIYKSFRLLCGAPEGFYQILRIYMKQIELKKGDVIINYQENVDSLYLILEGEVKYYMMEQPLKEDDLISLAQLRKETTHPMRRNITQLKKDVEVAIKVQRETFLEDFFLLKPNRRLSKSKIVVSSLNISLLTISFHDLFGCLQSYPTFKNIFLGNCSSVLSHDRHLKQVNDYT